MGFLIFGTDVLTVYISLVLVLPPLWPEKPVPVSVTGKAVYALPQKWYGNGAVTVVATVLIRRYLDEFLTSRHEYFSFIDWIFLMKYSGKLPKFGFMWGVCVNQRKCGCL